MTGKQKHRAIAVAWIAAFPVLLLIGLGDSVPIILFLSLYANASTHWDIATTAD